jgi:phage terminase Nu1 subunit (DNA packaging protein)
MTTPNNGVNAATVARVINLSVSRVHALAQEPGFPPKLAPGKFDVQKVTLWYVRYLQAELTRRGPSGGVETASILKQRLRLLKAQAENCERENAIGRGEYLQADVVQTLWTRQLTNAKRRLLALPSKVAPMLINRPEPGLIAEIIKKELYVALTALASGGAADALVTADALSEDDPAADDVGEL